MTNTIGSIRTGTPQTLPRRRPSHRRYSPWRALSSRIRPYVRLAEQRGELLLYGADGTYGAYGTYGLPGEAR
ncbi:hypothetical protein EKD16_09365 [Streptomonospora litoralis]|uniref:Uncharacterized protein n=1 Tax=Streptomonospora litoralis TaxID=2498135 RepID=A0A4P6Q4L8_9ACTN|nr:hypothetical protein EKD16_09365 [Streptomonospora litoralis]